MNTYFDSAVRVALILGAALLAMPLLRGRAASARRLVLAAAFVAALVVPFLPSRVVHVEAPAGYHAVVARVVAEPAVDAPTHAVSSASSLGLDWLALLWAIGALAVGLRFAIGFFRASQMARRAVDCGDVRVSGEIEAPAVAGIFRPVVLVPRAFIGWSEERKRAVLLHEHAHIRAHDVRVQALAAIVCTLHWFNPLAWLAAARLRLERELAADETVIASGMRASSYATDLLAIAGSGPLGTISMGEKPILRRIAAIVASRRPAPLGRIGMAGLLVGSAATTFAIACTNVAEPRPADVKVENKSAAVPAPIVANDLQAVATTELSRSVDAWHASGGAILVLTPQGEVLAQAGDADRTIVAGSTMKTMLLAAALEEGLVTESDSFESAPVGVLLAKSSNPGFSRIFERVGSDKLGRSLHRFGFATPDTLDVGAAIGSTMTATPRQVARAYATLARGGDNAVSSRTASRVSTLLEGVVASEVGTGKKARVAGQRVAGKTGTSDWTADGVDYTYASFVGFVPAEKPRYVIYVGIESARGEKPWGGEVAAPVFARIATQALAR